MGRTDTNDRTLEDRRSLKSAFQLLGKVTFDIHCDVSLADKQEPMVPLLLFWVFMKVRVT